MEQWDRPDMSTCDSVSELISDHMWWVDGERANKEEIIYDYSEGHFIKRSVSNMGNWPLIIPQKQEHSWPIKLDPSIRQHILY